MKHSRMDGPDAAGRDRVPLDPDQLVVVLQRAMAAWSEVVAGYLFGSYALGRARPDSDVDVALLLDASFDLAADPLYRLHRMNDLSMLLGREVDVVVLNNAPLVLRNQVLTYGRRIYEADHRQRVDYEVLSRQLYFDFLPILDRIYAAMHRQIKEGTYGHQYRGHRGAVGDAARAPERLEGSETYDV